MALSESNSDDFTLEEDIPGTKLQKPAEQGTVAVLKRRLKSRESEKIWSKCLFNCIYL